MCIIEDLSVIKYHHPFKIVITFSTEDRADNSDDIFMLGLGSSGISIIEATMTRFLGI